jgi:hypothetical protein
MVRKVRVTNACEVRDAPERGHGQSTMHEAIVHEQVQSTEGRHTKADAERDLATEARRSSAAIDDQRGSEGRVRTREGIVGFPPTGAATMMRAMHAPKGTVPDLAVQQHRPELHRRGGRYAGEQPNDRRAHAWAS